MRCDAMQVCDSIYVPASAGVSSGVKPVFAQGACVHVYAWRFLCLCVFFLIFQEQGSLFSVAYAAIHPVSFVAAVEGGGVHIRGYLDAY
jgi:hypothetical protein